MRRIMYIEHKCGLDGEGRIGWVELSRSNRSYRYQGKTLSKVGNGYKYNCIEGETGCSYWVSGPHKNGSDKLYGGVVHIDEDARVEYWTRIRGMPGMAAEASFRSGVGTHTAPSTRRNERRARRVR